MIKDKSKLPSRTSGTTQVDAFLDNLARTDPQGGRDGVEGRLVFAMDATASREASWDQASRIQGEMFEATRNLGALGVQLAFFRGFGEFKVSRWLSDANEIRRLMMSVSCRAGSTQVGKVLKHGCNEALRSGVRAIVYVGDCFEEDVDGVGEVAGELGILGVPVFMFHEGTDATAARAFRHIAKLSGGAYVRFDEGSAEILKRLFAAVAVFAAGGRAALDDYARREGGEILQISHQMVAK